MSGEKLNAIEIAKVLNDILNRGVAIQPNSLFHDQLNHAVGFRKYEVGIDNLDEVIGNLKSITKSLIEQNQSGLHDIELYTLCDIIKQLTNG